MPIKLDMNEISREPMSKANDEPVSTLTNMDYYDGIYNKADHMVYYAITIKHVNNRVIDYPLDLDAFVDKHLKAFQIVKKVYELDSRMKLHMHIMATAPINTKIRPVRYWKVDLQVVRDYNKWMGYMQKCAKNELRQDEILLDHYSYHNYMFDMEV